MITCMRTTIVIDDALFRSAKRCAASRGVTLSQLIADALRSSLNERVRPAPRFEVITYGSSASPVHHEPSDLVRAVEEDDRTAVEE